MTLESSIYIHTIIYGQVLINLKNYCKINELHAKELACFIKVITGTFKRSWSFITTKQLKLPTLNICSLIIQLLSI